VLGEVAEMVIQIIIINFFLAKFPQPINEVAPDLAPLGLRQALVMQRQLDARLECFVEAADTVRG
jgi:hypothetical protein